MPSASVAGAEERLLQDCPSCGYCLRGLPIKHKCPECSFAIDRRWEVFGGRALQAGVRSGRIRAPWRWCVLVPVFVASLFFVQDILIPVRSSSSTRIIAVLVLLALAGILMRWPLRKDFIGVGPDGLTLVRGRRRMTYAWHHMGRAHYAIMHGCIEFDYAGATVVRIVVTPIFRAARGEIDRCVQAINAHPRAVGNKGE